MTKTQNPKLKIKKGDTVMVMAGKDKGKTGKIERVFPKKGKVLIMGVGEYKRHVKSRGDGKPGEIMTLPRPISVAKVKIVDPKSKLPTRIGFRFDGEKKIRVSRKSNADL